MQWNVFLPTYLDDDGKNQVFELCNIVFMTKRSSVVSCKVDIESIVSAILQYFFVNLNYIPIDKV